MRFVLAFLLMFSTAFAQEKAAENLPPLLQHETWDYYTDSRLNKKVFLVVDVSSSMSPTNAINRAIAKVTEFMNQYHEDTEICLVTFTSDFWIFRPKDGNPWFKLPSMTGRIEELRNYIATLGITSCSYTDPTGALRWAISNADENSCILLVTDGDFGNQWHPEINDNLMREVDRLQKKSMKDKGFQVPIFSYIIGLRRRVPIFFAVSYGGWVIRYYSDSMRDFMQGLLGPGPHFR